MSNEERSAPKPIQHPAINKTVQSPYEIALGINSATAPKGKEFIPTQIGVIYEENSLIGSVQDDRYYTH